MRGIVVPADRLLELIDAHDEWVGCLHPDDHDVEWFDESNHGQYSSIESL